jgi:hypothetical protein
MIRRLDRIQTLVLSFTTVLVVTAMWSDLTPPLGVVFGGAAAWLDFVVLRGLGGAMLARRPVKAHLVPLAMSKSLALIAIPGVALVLPGSLVDGISFALGVTTLPVAIVVDALMPFVPDPKTGDV